MQYSVDYSEKKTIVLYGAGKRCKRLLDELEGLDSFQIYVTDTDEKKRGMVYRSFTVTSTKEIPTNCLWCITVGDKESCSQIREKCINIFGLHKDKEITYQQLVFEINLIKWKKTSTLDRRFANPISNATIVFGCLIGLGLGGVEKWTMDLGKVLSVSIPHKSVKIVTGAIDNVTEDEIDNFVITLGNREDWFTQITKICDALLKNTPCHVICSLPDDFLLAALNMKNGNNMQIITVLHNDTDEYIEKFVNAWNRYGNIDCFVGVSERICDKLRARIPSGRILLMPRAIECEVSLDREYSVNVDDSIKLGYAGRMDGYAESQKRMDLIVNLLRELEARNINFVCELAGDGGVRKKMETDLDDLICNKKVSFVGVLNKSEISDFWKSRDIAINLSDFEGHSLSQMEAMANGAVPVLTDVSGVRDDVVDGENGYIIPRGDYRTAADRIQFLSENRSIIKKMGEKAHKKIALKATKEIYISFWQDVLDYQFS